MDSRLRIALEAQLSTAVQSAEAVSGGDINEAHRVALADGRRVFVKTNASAPAHLFTAEARGLEWLREAGVVRVPRVVAVSSGVTDAGALSAYLVLEYIEPGQRRANFDEKLGRALAHLHQSGAPSFGLDHDNFIGLLPQPNQPLPTWSQFYRERRLGPQLERAMDNRRAPERLVKKFERLFARLEDLVGPPEPPARLHGDLWGGNLHVDDTGAPCLIDPAVYGGHREVDLAMMKLFGGYSARVFEAYAEAYPLTDGHRDRVDLYQLYPLLVHLNHFGQGYLGSVERALERYV